jgi:FeS assembly protein IscX
VELRDKVLSLDEFDDDKDKSGEKILEAIQGFWIEEKD